MKKAIFYIKGSFVGEIKKEEFTFEELGINEKDSEDLINDKLENYFEYHFLKDDIEAYYYEDGNNQGYYFGIKGFKGDSYYSNEDLRIDENTSEEKKIEILESTLNDILGQYDAGWLFKNIN